MGQCLLAVKEMGDNNQGGIVYGFVTLLGIVGGCYVMMLVMDRFW